MHSAESAQSLLVGRLHADYELARHAAFALFVQVLLEQTGRVARRFVPEAGSAPIRPPLGELPDAVAQIRRHNAHLLAYFGEPPRREVLAALDEAAAGELIGWLRVQRLDAEEPQIVYELATLALGVELPGILVGALRQLELMADTRVAELPDGSGYPAVFLSTLHPHWRAAGNTTLFVEGTDAEQLAALAMVLLARDLTPPPGSVVRVSEADRTPLRAVNVDLAIVYNPVPWLAAPRIATTAVPARQVLLV